MTYMSLYIFIYFCRGNRVGERPYVQATSGGGGGGTTTPGSGSGSGVMCTAELHIIIVTILLTALVVIEL